MTIGRLACTVLCAFAIAFCAGTAALAASHFAEGEYRGHTSQKVRGEVLVWAMHTDDTGQPVVRVALGWNSTCKRAPKPGFHSTSTLPSLFEVSPDGRFGATERHTVSIDGTRTSGHITGRVAGMFVSPTSIHGSYSATIKVFDHGRQIDTCRTGTMTFKANR
jgi:hypothetical protein